MNDPHAIIGELTIAPPITPAEITALPERDIDMCAEVRPRSDAMRSGVYLAVASGTANNLGVSDGPAGHGIAIAVGTDGWTEGGSADLAAAVQEIVDAFGTTPDGQRRTFDGYLHGEYTGNGDPFVYRIAVVDGRAHVYLPATTWPAAVDANGYEPPPGRTDGQRALARLPFAVRLRMLDRVYMAMEFGDIDGEGEPGTEWNPDRWQDLDRVFAGAGVTFTSTNNKED
ncbi:MULTISPECIES: DUF6205 family protein [Asanoa]|uniref:Uncharacterized protein n=2 Tax=Asanoa TaxID=195964 RepID=A0A239PF86_9ACTN|nr:MULTISPECIES: DUF6205 family protein [Asanoa]GIF74165.1 hypothetical protein Asi02nite_36830 [Asanoa siamensis]SNT65681.1 hypothetical protein SAMN05421812_12524 [Asanoa hainanensis]